MTSIWEEVASSLSAIFLSGYDLPDMEIVKNMILLYYEDQPKYVNGLTSLQNLVYALMLQIPEFFCHSYTAGEAGSKLFSQKFNYQGESKDEDVVLKGISHLIEQNVMLSEEEIQCIADYERCVVLFNKVKNARMYAAIDFIEGVFGVFYGKHGIVNPFKGDTKFASKGSGNKVEEYLNALRAYKRSEFPAKFAEMKKKENEEEEEEGDGDEKMPLLPLNHNRLVKRVCNCEYDSDDDCDCVWV